MSKVKDEDIFNFIKTKMLEQGDKCLDESGDMSFFGIKKSDYDKFSDFESTFEEYEDYDFREMFEIYTRDMNIPNAYCAVGFIMFDYINKYGIDFNLNGSVNDSEIINIIRESNPDWEITDDSIGMLNIAQFIHDMCEPNEWSKYFTYFSRFFKDGNWIGKFENGISNHFKHEIDKLVNV